MEVIRDSSSSTVAGGSYNIGNGDGGGPGGNYNLVLAILV